MPAGPSGEESVSAIELGRSAAIRRFSRLLILGNRARPVGGRRSLHEVCTPLAGERSQVSGFSARVNEVAWRKVGT